VAARAAPGRLQAGLAEAARRVGLGSGLADSLERLVASTGEAARPLVALLADALRYGTPVEASLDRLADEARRDRQRRVERAARRAPVHLLFPLVLCILPAFVLLTLAPVLASGLRALRL
jgi:tight adherence protein C